MFGINKIKNNREWKEKALKRRKVIKDLNKRINELERSRNTWKEKANNLKKLNKNLNIELKKNT